MSALVSEREKARAIDVILQEQKIMVKTLKGEILLDINNKTAGLNMDTKDLIELGNSKSPTNWKYVPKEFS